MKQINKIMKMNIHSYIQMMHSIQISIYISVINTLVAAILVGGLQTRIPSCMKDITIELLAKWQHLKRRR